MDLEHELTRLLHARDVPLQVEDPVAAVHRGMRSRRRNQRLQVLTAGVGVLAIALGGSFLLSSQRDVTVPTPAVRPTSDPAAVPPGYQVQDVSFTNDTDGFALGVAPCAAGHCQVLLATDDGGQSWVRRTVPDQPVVKVRFAAGSLTGYAFGPGLALTFDGGRTWADQQVTGSVVDLAITGNAALRVVDPNGACPCPGFEVDRSDLGGAAWQPLTSTTGGTFVSASLETRGDRLLLLERGHTSGGAENAHSVVLTSSNGGARWTTRPDPCGDVSGTDEVDATQVSLAPEGVVAALCQHRSGGATSVVVSTDSGQTYSPERALPSQYPGRLLAAPGGVLVVAADEPGTIRPRLLRSTDQGRTWSSIVRQAGYAPEGSELLAFSSDKVGTWVGGDRRRLLRTTDAGATWTDLRIR